jgi:hypothetical protein
MSRCIRLVAALGVFLAAAAHAQPAVLSLLQGEVSVQTAGPGLPNNVVRDPWLVDITAGTSYGRSSLVGGLFQARAEWLPSYTGPYVQIAYSAADINLQNTGAAPIALGPISVLFDASLTQALDTDAGNLGQFVRGILAANVGGTVQTADAGYSYSASRTPGGPFTDFLNTVPQGTAGGSASIFTATPSSFEAGLSLPGFTLAPGEVLRILFSLQTGAIGSGNWGALTDASMSAHLSMQVPAGVVINAAQPLDWVTPVPEPAGFWLLLAGLAALGPSLAARRARR